MASFSFDISELENALSNLENSVGNLPDEVLLTDLLTDSFIQKNTKFKTIDSMWGFSWNNNY